MQGPGLLHMPSSWLHQLITSLPPKDRLALFQTCRQLSRQVMHSSPTVTLCRPQPFSMHDWMLWLLQHIRAPYVTALTACLILHQVFIAAIELVRLLHSIQPNIAKAAERSEYFPMIIVMFTWLLQIVCVSMSCKWLLVLRWKRNLIDSIAAVLSTDCSFHLITNASSAATMPCSLYQCITALVLLGDSNYFHRSPWSRPVFLRWFPWSAFTMLQQLTVSGNCHDAALRRLQRALEAGHLQVLQQLALYPDGGDVPECQLLTENVLRAFAQTAARKLGPRLTHLATNCPHLWSQLQHFTALQTVEIGAATLCKEKEKQRYANIIHDVLQQLCEHPTVHIVTLRACDMADAWAFDQLSCNFSALVMDGTFLRILAAMSLSKVQMIKFVAAAPLSSAADSGQALRLVYAHYFKVIGSCVPAGQSVPAAE